MPTSPEMARQLWAWLERLEECLGSKAEPVFEAAAWRVPLLAANAPHFVGTAVDPALRLLTVSVVAATSLSLMTLVDRPPGRGPRRLINALMRDVALAPHSPVWMRDAGAADADRLLAAFKRYRAEIHPRQPRLRPNARKSNPR